MTAEWFLYTLILAMIVLWSGNFVVGKLALREFPPLLLVGLRISLAGLFVAPVYWRHSRQAKERWSRSDVPMLVFLGLFGVTLNQLLFVVGLSRTSVAHSAIIIGLTPILVLLIAGSMRLERITRRKAAGMLVALAGVAILKAFEQRSASGPTWAGDALIFLAGLAFALFTAVGKRETRSYDSITVNSFAYIGGALALAPITLWYGSQFSFRDVSLGGWASLLYMALFPSVICYLIYFHALTRISASRVSAFTYLQPVLATLMGVGLLGERLSGALVVGGMVIFSGVYLAERG